MIDIGKLANNDTPVFPDLIVPWPVHLDYPPFRLFVRYYRRFFNRVFIVFTPYESEWNFVEEVKRHMKLDFVDFITTETKSGEDWRNIATNAALNLSTSKWILFMEQDFLIAPGKHLENIWRQKKHSQIIGFKESGTRLHPGFLLVERKVIDRTDRDFSAYPPEYDHFDKFTEQFGSIHVTLLDDIGIEKDRGYKHMNGLSHNLALCQRGDTKDIYKRDEFVEYLENSDLNIEVTQKYKDLIAHCKKVLNES